MAGSVDIRFLGISRLQAKLEAKKKAIQGEAMVEALNKAAAVVTSTAKSIVPVRTGALRSSIHPIKAEVSDGKVTSGASTAMEYAPYVEFGTGVRGAETHEYEPKGVKLAYRPDWPGMIAQPFMYPALHQNKDKIQKLVRAAMIKAVLKGGK